MSVASPRPVWCACILCVLMSRVTLALCSPGGAQFVRWRFQRAAYSWCLQVVATWPRSPEPSIPGDVCPKPGWWGVATATRRKTKGQWWEVMFIGQMLQPSLIIDRANQITERRVTAVSMETNLNWFQTETHAQENVSYWPPAKILCSAVVCREQWPGYRAWRTEPMPSQALHPTRGKYTLCCTSGACSSPHGTRTLPVCRKYVSCFISHR